MSNYPNKGAKLLNDLKYDNVFFPFEDCFRNDRIVAYSHDTKNRIEIYNNGYPLKYNEETKKIMKITTEENRAISFLKKEINWEEKNYINYLTPRKDEEL